jgi:ankyrin repeat protein
MINLYEALETGNVAAIHEAASAGRNLNVQHRETGDSLLTLAIRHSTREFVEALLAAGCDPNFKKTCTSALGETVIRGDRELVQLLLDAGAQVDAREEEGDTPLMYAAAKGNVEVVKQLLAAGANPKAKDRYGTSALVSAAEKGHRDVCDILMPLSSPSDRERAALIAELKGHAEWITEMKRLLLASGKGDEETVRQAVLSGMPVDALSANGTTLLMAAANEGRLELLQLLISKGANVNRKNASGDYALSYAAAGGNSNTYDYLYPLTDKKLRKRAEKIKENKILREQWR